MLCLDLSKGDEGPVSTFWRTTGGISNRFGVDQIGPQ